MSVRRDAWATGRLSLPQRAGKLRAAVNIAAVEKEGSLRSAGTSPVHHPSPEKTAGYVRSAGLPTSH